MNTIEGPAPVEAPIRQGTLTEALEMSRPGPSGIRFAVSVPNGDLVAILLPEQEKPTVRRFPRPDARGSVGDGEEVPVEFCRCFQWRSA